MKRCLRRATPTRKATGCPSSPRNIANHFPNSDRANTLLGYSWLLSATIYQKSANCMMGGRERLYLNYGYILSKSSFFVGC
ncbi:hypothetical protein IQ277_18975 [Nostocales cyanobacterium LEGE 12452]|nr:hypothetical protein [Nostocales cyanobacterium LEGE 12452]